MDYFKKTERILNKLPAKFSVEYALLCALDVKDLIKTAEGLQCIDLTQRWLVDENSVTSDELYAASAAAYAAASATNDGVTSAVTYTSASAAYAAASSTITSANAAYAAASAAYAISYTADKTSKYYYDLLLIFVIKQLTPLECSIFEINL